MRAKVQATGLKLTCECGRVHLIRSFGKREGHWRCQCTGSIHWKLEGKAEMLIPVEPVDEQKDLFNIFNTPKKKKR